MSSDKPEKVNSETEPKEDVDSEEEEEELDPSEEMLARLEMVLGQSILDAEERQRVLTQFLGMMAHKPLTAEERAILASPSPQPLSTPDLAGIAKYIKEGHAKNIIVMTGAGISVSAGIPDFRSPGSGLYFNLQKYNLEDPTDLFTIDYFQQNPKPFYEVVKGLYPDLFHPTKAHYFIKLLAQKGLLLRNFTQNIDTLEFIAGIPDDKIVYSHGSFSKSHCVTCHKEYTYEHVREKVFANEIPFCECGGYIKPDIVFFGENLPAEFFQRKEEDFPKCDLLIVMGTSLVVHPFAGLISQVPENVPRLLINKEIVGAKPPLKPDATERERYTHRISTKFAFRDADNRRDALYQGTCDVGVQELADALGWGEELQAMFDAPVERHHE